MRFLHLSDLHFGTEAEDIVQHLMDVVTTLTPDLIVISGDFVQIANDKEFEKARNFINSLPSPVFCVAGNHDIPRYNWAERFLNPYKKYKKYVNENLEPVLTGDQYIMIGLNTARAVLPHWNWANGAISQAQIKRLKDFFAGERNAYRICVMHHPLHKAEKAPLNVTVFGASAAMQAIHDMQVDLVLTGHVHHASLTTIQNTVFASASTAISSRLRSQENGFNVIDFNEDFFEISHFVYNKKNFFKKSTHCHEKNK
ncbi:MAG: metallophosphoesterase [Alphaproteobacteria bacterium]|nr:metallophosphoesterase [Alphaproteobacteria bacterium]